LFHCKLAAADELLVWRLVNSLSITNVRHGTTAGGVAIQGRFSSRLCCAVLCYLIGLLQNAGLQGGTKDTSSSGMAHCSSSSLASWGTWELHLLVAHFLAARFPILLALNKVRSSAAVDQYDVQKTMNDPRIGIAACTAAVCYHFADCIV
jgi:hypothetical protein